MTIRGNRRVLSARLEDALFFFEADLQRSLETRLEDLKKIAFHEKLGTMFDRVKRLGHIGDYLLCELSASPKNALIFEHFSASSRENLKTLLKRTITLSKCDLATGMVTEFPELQGVIGGHYARLQGEHEDISNAIADQYKPPEEMAEAAFVGGLLALADKIDLIASFFGIDKGPTGSRDPFALRRAAIGIIKIILKFNLSINLKSLLEKICGNLAQQITEKQYSPREAAAIVMAFILERLKIMMVDVEGVRPEVVIAVASHQDDLLSIWQTAKTLDVILKSDAGSRVIMAYRRAKNILKSLAEDSAMSSIKQELLQETDEKLLFSTIELLNQQLKTLDDAGGDVSEKIRQKINFCLNIEPFISDFFTNVLVNAPLAEIRHNRQMLLKRLIMTFDSVLPFQLFCE
jgi:glycyl-tRNA synthetase beta chain